MKLSLSVMLTGLCLSCTLPAAAQTVGILQSAEIIDRGVFKLMLAPIMELGKDGGDDEWGLAARVGYGLSERFDAEAKFGFFDNGTYFGIDGEYGFLKGNEKDEGVDLSLTGGVHWTMGKNDRLDTMGIDLAPELSFHLSPRFELCGTLDANFGTVSDLPPGVDDSFTGLHFVPGIEYKLSETADLVGEFGIALNDDSANYVGLGFALYLK